MSLSKNARSEMASFFASTIDRVLKYHNKRNFRNDLIEKMVPDDSIKNVHSIMHGLSTTVGRNTALPLTKMILKDNGIPFFSREDYKKMRGPIRRRQGQSIERLIAPMNRKRFEYDPDCDREAEVIRRAHRNSDSIMHYSEIEGVVPRYIYETPSCGFKIDGTLYFIRFVSQNSYSFQIKNLKISKFIWIAETAHIQDVKFLIVVPYGTEKPMNIRQRHLFKPDAKVSKAFSKWLDPKELQEAEEYWVPIGGEHIYEEFLEVAGEVGISRNSTIQKLIKKRQRTFDFID